MEAGMKEVSNVMLYAQSTIRVISGQMKEKGV